MNLPHVPEERRGELRGGNSSIFRASCISIVDNFTLYNVSNSIKLLIDSKNQSWKKKKKKGSRYPIELKG